MLPIASRPHAGAGGPLTPGRRVLALVAATLLVLLGATTGAVPQAAADGSRGTDRTTVTGYDFETDSPADVVVGSSGNNLSLRVDAGRPLNDGTVVWTLPRPAWRTSLQVGDALYEGDPALDGSVVVRPDPRFGALGPGDCRGTSGRPVVTVLDTTTAHIAVVSHLTCAAGQSVTVRVFGIKAPKSVGTYSLPVSVSDSSGQRGPTHVRIRVVPRPTTTLRVDVPTTVPVDTSTPLLLRALRPDGRLDTAYRGTVGIRAVDDDDCSLRLDESRVTFQASDAGVKVVHFGVQLLVSHRLEARDVGHRARTGRSGRYDVVGPLMPVVCSVSYH